MSTRKLSALVIASLFAIAGSAQAENKWLGDRGDNWLENVTSTKTRTQVIAELKEAQAQGLIGNENSDYPKTAVVKSSRSRDAVRAEAASAPKAQVRTMDYSSGQ